MSPKPSPEDSDFAPSQKEKNLSGVNEINYFLGGGLIILLMNWRLIVFYLLGYIVGKYILS